MKVAQLAFVLSLIKSIIVVGLKRMDKVSYGGGWNISLTPAFVDKNIIDK